MRSIVGCAVVVFLMLVLSGLAEDAEEQPTTAELAAQLVTDPSAIGDMIEDLTEDETADLVAAAVLAMSEADLADATIRQNLATIFARIAEVRGAKFGAAVMTRIRKRVNPRLLPTIKTGDTPPPPPPSPKYRRQ